MPVPARTIKPFSKENLGVPVFRRSFHSGLKVRALIGLVAVTFLAGLSLTGCGGSPAITIAVTAAASSVDGSDSTKLTATLTNDGNNAGVTWSVSGGGALSNTTATSATYTAPAPSSSPLTVTITATSVADTSKTASVTITVAAAPAISTGALAAGTVGTTYTATLTATGGIAPYTWSLASGTLPACLTIVESASGASITGTLTASCAGTYNITLKVIDSGTPTPLTATAASLSLTINAAPAIAFTGVMPATATYNTPYTGSAAATGGAGALTYSTLSGALPTGLSLNTGNGAVTGTPTAVGPFNFTIKAADAFGDSANQAYAITVNLAVPTLVFAAIPTKTYGNAPFTVSASSPSSGAVTYSLTGGQTSSGTVTSAGVVTLTGAGTVYLTASQAASGDYAAATATTSFTVLKATPTINVTPYSVTYDGNAHTATATATGVSGANLIADLTLSGTTHTNAGTYASDPWTFTDPTGNYASANGTVSDTISKATATINVTPYSVTYDGNAHTATGTATGVGSANLNADLTLSGTTHTNAGTYASDAWSFTDPNGNYASASGTVSDAISKATATINVTPYSVTYDGNPHTATATATGVGGVALSATDFTLTGTTHTNAGTYASDAWSFTDPNYASASGTVSDAISKATATVNVTPYSVTYDGNPHTATGTATGVGGVTLSATDFNLTGTTHTNVGTYASDPWSFTDPNYASASGTVSDTISKATATINVTPYSVTYDGNPHTATATATGAGGVNLISDLTLTGTTHTNVGTYASDPWSFTDPTGNYASASGTVSDAISKATATINIAPYNVTYDGNPHTATGTATGVGGANLNADLTLSGTTHTNAGTYATDPWSFTDPTGNYANASGTVSDTINGEAITLTFTAVPTHVYGDPAFQVYATDSSGPVSGGAISYSVTSGPATIVSSTGLVTLTGAGTVVLGASQAASGNYAAATASTSFTVDPALSITTPSALPAGVVNTLYSQTLAATGGTGGYGWATNSAGTASLATVNLTLSPAGKVSGTPTGIGSATFAATVTDSTSHTATVTFTVQITNALTITTTNASLPPAYTNALYSQTLTAAGGTGLNYVWSVSGTSNLSTFNMTLSAGGVLSGTPTTTGTASFTAQVKDSGGNTATQAYSIPVYAPLSLPAANPSTLGPATTNVLYSGTIVAAGGSGSGYVFTVTGLPSDNLSNAVNNGSNTLTIGGTPTLTKAVTFQVSVKDSLGNSAGPVTYTIAVNPPTPLTLQASGALTGATTNVAYSGGINASGGSGSGYVFTVNGVQIPTTGALVAILDSISVSNNAGPTLSISGTPTTAQTVSLTSVTVKDSAGDTAGPDTYTIVVSNPPPLTLPAPNPASLPSATVNQAYNGSIIASGGVGPTYTWTVNGLGISAPGLSVTLTNGLSATTTDNNVLTITGTPTTNAMVTFTAAVADSASQAAGPTTYTIAVNNLASISGQFFLQNYCYNGNSNLPVTFTVGLYNGATLVQSTTTDVNGNYSFTSIPNGTYTITPSLAGAATLFYPASYPGVTLNSSGNNNVTGENFNANVGFTVSGTVSYSGSQTGQTYLVMNNNSCGSGTGTSITEATLTSGGAFTIHGVPPGSNTLQAWMDPLGQDVQNAIDATGSVAVTVDGNVSSADLTMADPTFATPYENPTIQVIIPNAQGVLIEFKPSRNNSGNGVEDANQYVVQWSTSSTLGGGTGGGQFATIAGSHTFTASGDKGVWVLNNVVLSGSGYSFTSGQTYYFQARSFDTLDTANPHPSGWCNYTASGCGGTTNFTAVKIATPTCTGNCTAVSSSVTIPAGITINSGAPLYLGLVQVDSSGNPIGIYVTEITSPVNGVNNFPQPITVPSGSNYAVVGILDQDKAGGLGAGTISNTNNNLQANLTISGTSQTVPGITLPVTNATATVSTQWSSQTCQGCGATTTNYQLNFDVSESNKLPVAVTLTSGPNMINTSGTVAIDMGNNCNGCGNAQLQYSVTLPGGTPKVGDTYDFTVTYSDGSHDSGSTVNAAVTGWDGGSTIVGPSDAVAPSSMLPSGSTGPSAGTRTTPTFTWTDSSSSTGSDFNYSFYLSDQTTCSGNCTIWQIPGQNSKANGFSSSITSITWDVDPISGDNSTPSVGSLTTGDVYNWQIYVQDPNGNSASTNVWYQP